VQIGTASFTDPQASVTVLEGIEKYLSDKGYGDIKEIVGIVNKKR